jgi:hypothetical protein
MTRLCMANDANDGLLREGNVKAAELVYSSTHTVLNEKNDVDRFPQLNPLTL